MSNNEELTIEEIKPNVLLKSSGFSGSKSFKLGKGFLSAELKINYNINPDIPEANIDFFKDGDNIGSIIINREKPIFSIEKTIIKVKCELSVTANFDEKTILYNINAGSLLKKKGELYSW